MSNLIKGLKVGAQYIVSIENGLCTGQMHSINKRSITLVNVDTLYANSPRCNLRHFCWDDIKSIKPVELGKDTDSTTATGSSEESSTLSSIDLEVLTMPQNAVYLQQVDKTYLQAMQDIKRYNILGVNMENTNIGRFSSPSMVAIATPNNIYLFDIQFLGEFPRELVAIMVSEKYTKVVHNSRSMVDYLRHKYEVDCKKIFDTMVVHISLNSVTGNGSEISIDRCAMEYLRFPDGCFTMDALNGDSVDWHARPLSADNKLLCAKRVGLLLSMYDHLLHKVMLAPYYANYTQYINLLTLANNDVAFKIHRVNSDIGVINKPFELNIEPLNLQDEKI